MRTGFREVAPRKNNPPMLVSELIDNTSAEWKLNVLEEYMYPMDAEIIKAIPLSTVNQNDTWAWHFERTGLFTVRSIYRLLVSTKRTREDWLEGRPASSASTTEQKLWTTMWKTKVPSKIRVFLWRLAHQSLPTGSVRHHRNMATTAGCPFCATVSDDWRHSLLDCTTARCVWALIDDELTEHISINKCGNAKEWIFFLIETLSHEQFTKTVVTLWAVWSARRKAIHEDIFQSPLTILGFISKYLAELAIAHPIRQKRVTPQASPVDASWIAPRFGFAKVNVDAAVSKHENRGVVAAICRDQDRIFLGASALAVPGISNPAILEAIACREGLSLAADRVQVASDCLEVINSIRYENKCNYYSILCDIAHRRAEFTDVRFSHEKRAFNVCGF